MILFTVFVLFVMPVKSNETAADQVRVENVYFANQKDCDDFWNARTADLIDIAHAHRHGFVHGDRHQKPVPHAPAGAQATYTCVEKDKP